MSYTGCIFCETRHSDHVLYRIYRSWNQTLWSSLSYIGGVIPETRLNLDLINLINQTLSIIENHITVIIELAFSSTTVAEIKSFLIGISISQKFKNSNDQLSQLISWGDIIILQFINQELGHPIEPTSSSKWDYSLNQPVITPCFKEGKNVYT